MFFLSVVVLLLQGLVMDVLRALNSPNMDIREKTLAIAMELITPRNIDEVKTFQTIYCCALC